MTDPAVVALLDGLRQRLAGHRVWLVGGAVRDELLGRPVRDLDCAVSGTMEQVRAALGPWVEALWTQGQHQPTLGAEKDGRRLELTVLGDGALADDLARRDFTVNALARDLHTGALLDPGQGCADLAAQRLRAVGDPTARFREDPIRLLRACRLAAELDFTIADETAAALRAEAARLAETPSERAGDELQGLLCGPRPRLGLRWLAAFGLLRHLATELEDLRGLPQPPRYHRLDAWEHTVACVGLTPPAPVLRWAALLHDIGKPKTASRDADGIHFFDHEAVGAAIAETLLRRWARPRALRERIVRLVAHHMALVQYRPEWTDAAVRRLLRHAGSDWDHLVRLTIADQHAGRPDAASFRRRLRHLQRRVEALGGAEALTRPQPLLTAAEIMEVLDWEPGPAVGEALRFLAEEQAAGRIRSADEARIALGRRFGPRVVSPEGPG